MLCARHKCVAFVILGKYIVQSKWIRGDFLALARVTRSHETHITCIRVPLMPPKKWAKCDCEPIVQWESADEWMYWHRSSNLSWDLRVPKAFCAHTINSVRTLNFYRHHNFTLRLYYIILCDRMMCVSIELMLAFPFIQPSISPPARLIVFILCVRLCVRYCLRLLVYVVLLSKGCLNEKRKVRVVVCPNLFQFNFYFLYIFFCFLRSVSKRM